MMLNNVVPYVLGQGCLEKINIRLIHYVCQRYQMNFKLTFVEETNNFQVID